MKDTSKKPCAAGITRAISVVAQTGGGGSAICRNRLQDRQASAYIHLLQHAAEAIAILQQQAHEVRTQGWRDPMSVTLESGMNTG